jgi:hypothetical protein
MKYAFEIFEYTSFLGVKLRIFFMFQNLGPNPL